MGRRRGEGLGLGFGRLVSVRNGGGYRLDDLIIIGNFFSLDDIT